uniref:Uncharacterized protein n=1 Tax=Globodera rostochiensis TaxID=31243 RepID=A0A914GNV9_GLORO
MTAVSHQIAAGAAALPTKGPTAFLDSASLLVFAGALLLPSLFYMAVMILICCQCPGRRQHRRQQQKRHSRQAGETNTCTTSSSSTASTLDVELQAVQQQQLREVAEHKF